jgi:sugar phosphate isomerase/epimerase
VFIGAVKNVFISFLTGGQLGDLDKTLQWAAAKGFRGISVSTSPSSDFFNVKEAISDSARLRKAISDSGIVLSAIGFYGNPIHKDDHVRREHRDFFLNVIECAYRLEVPVATGWVGLFPGSVEDNVAEIKKVWPEIVRAAEDRGIKIAIENCPANIAYAPHIWERIFEAIPSESFGLEFDPSHLICQLIDVVEVEDEFGSRIHHTHLKDAEILWSKVSRDGVRSEGWCTHRLPGFGALDWAAFMSVLRKHKYDYALTIEHEDPYFGYEEGLVVAKKFLETFLP